MVQSTTSLYLAVSRNLPARQAATASRGDVKNATAYFLANIGRAATAKDLVDDKRLFSFAMTAYGLGDMLYAKGLMLRVLEGGTASPKALANTLSDPRYRAFAKAFDFAGLGAKATQDLDAAAATASRYVEQTLEDGQAKSDQGVADALYFRRNASSITSVYGLLADRTMLGVVEAAYGITATLGQTDIDTQAAVLGKVVKIADFQDPAKVDKLIGRFTAARDAGSGSRVTNVLLADPSNAASSILGVLGGGGSAPAGSVLSLFDAGSAQNGVSASVLLSLAKLPKGG